MELDGVIPQDVFLRSEDAPEANSGTVGRAAVAAGTRTLTFGDASALAVCDRRRGHRIVRLDL